MRSGVHGAEHRQAVLRLVVLDGVAAHHERARLAHLVGAAAQHVGHHVGAQAAREREDVERRQRLRPHGEHVGQRIRRGDGAELVGVVHHRGEEIERQHRGRVVVQTVDGGVVGRVEAQQQICVGRRRDVLQYLFEVSRTPLRRSTALLGKAGETNALCLAHGTPFACDESVVSRSIAVRPVGRSSRLQGVMHPVFGAVPGSRWPFAGTAYAVRSRKATVRFASSRGSMTFTEYS